MIYSFFIFFSDCITDTYVARYSLLNFYTLSLELIATISYMIPRFARLNDRLYWAKHLKICTARIFIF